MAFFRPSILLPGRYIRCLLRPSTALDNAVWQAAWDQKADGNPAPLDSSACRAASQSATPSSDVRQSKQHINAGGASQFEWGQHSYHFRPLVVPPLGGHPGVVRLDEEQRKTGCKGLRVMSDVPPGVALCPRAHWATLGGVRSHMGHSHGHGPHEAVPSEGERVVRLGLWSDIGLTIGKAGAGYVSGSTAMIADAAHSLSDIALSGVSWWSLRAAAVPRDKEHPYGHGKYESLGAFGVSLLLIATGAGIAWNALEALQATMGPALALASSSLPEAVGAVVAPTHSHALDTNNLGIALAAAVLSIGVKEGLYRQTQKVGEQTGSQLLMANAWHHRSDAVSSLVALVGVGGAYLGVPWLDPVAGMLLAGMIVKAGLDIATNSVQELVDASVPDPVLAALRTTALTIPGVRGCHGLRARKMGSNLVCDLTIDVAPFLSVSAAHNVAEVVKRALRRHNPSLVDVIVHVEPDGAAHASDDELLPHGAAATASAHSTRSSTRTLTQAQAEARAGQEHTHAADALRTSADAGEEYPLQSDVEARIRERVGAHFQQVTAVTHVTCHFLEKGSIARVTIQVNPKMTVQDAARLGRQVEADLEGALGDIQEADVHLELNSHAPTRGEEGGV